MHPMSLLTRPSSRLLCPREGGPLLGYHFTRDKTTTICKSGQQSSGGSGKRKARARRPGSTSCNPSSGTASQMLSPLSADEMSTNMACLIHTLNAGLFEVQKINPPPQSLGIHNLPVDTHNGDQITVEDEVRP